MRKYINGDLYVNSTELASVFTKSYGYKVTPADVNHVCATFKVPKNMINNMPFYNIDLIRQMRSTTGKFGRTLYNIVNFGDARGMDAYVQEPDIDYNEEPIENNMEKYSDYLINNVYENTNKKGKTIILTEEQFKTLCENINK